MKEKFNIIKTYNDIYKIRINAIKKIIKKIKIKK